MYRALLITIVSLLVGFSVTGCSKSRKHYYSSEAPITTHTVVFIDNFTEEDKIEIINSVATIFSQMLEDYPPAVNNTTNIEYNITVTKNEIDILIKGRDKFLSWCGPYNECPNLYEAFCRARFGEDHPDRPKWKNRGRQVEDDCRRNNRRRR